MHIVRLNIPGFLFRFIPFVFIITIAGHKTCAAETVTTQWSGDAELVYDTGFMHMLMKHPDGGGDPKDVGKTSFKSIDGGETWKESPFGPLGQTRCAGKAFPVSGD